MRLYMSQFLHRRQLGTACVNEVEALVEEQSVQLHLHFGSSHIQFGIPSTQLHNSESFQGYTKV